MDVNTSTTQVPTRKPGRVALGLGLLLVLIGPFLYVAQMQAKQLFVPWYVPGMATLGTVLILLALLRRGTIVRGVALVLCGLLAGAEWFFLLSLSKVPAYTGPAAVGSPFPAFATQLADGSPFDQDSLRGSQDTVFVFFRGRW